MFAPPSSAYSCPLSRSHVAVPSSVPLCVRPLSGAPTISCPSSTLPTSASLHAPISSDIPPPSVTLQTELGALICNVMENLVTKENLSLAARTCKLAAMSSNDNLKPLLKGIGEGCEAMLSSLSDDGSEGTSGSGEEKTTTRKKATIGHITTLILKDGEKICFRHTVTGAIDDETITSAREAIISHLKPGAIRKDLYPGEYTFDPESRVLEYKQYEDSNDNRISSLSISSLISSKKKCAVRINHNGRIYMVGYGGRGFELADRNGRIHMVRYGGRGFEDQDIERGLKSIAQDNVLIFLQTVSRRLLSNNPEYIGYFSDKKEASGMENELSFSRLDERQRDCIDVLFNLIDCLIKQNRDLRADPVIYQAYAKHAVDTELLQYCARLFEVSL